MQIKNNSQYQDHKLNEFAGKFNTFYLSKMHFKLNLFPQRFAN